MGASTLYNRNELELETRTTTNRFGGIREFTKSLLHIAQTTY